MKLANPLHYPVTIVVAGVALVGGIRLARVPAPIMLPLSVAIAIGGAAFRQSQASVPEVGNSELKAELNIVHRQAQVVVQQAEEIRQLAAHQLSEPSHLELLVAVQSACDRASELPAKVLFFTERIQGKESEFAIDELQQQLIQVEQRLSLSPGIAYDQLTKLAEGLQHGIQLAWEGQDTRQAQMSILSMLVLDAVEVLQQMQNLLQLPDLPGAAQIADLQRLSEELGILQANIAFLVN
ncbi:MAG: hypothetical protein Kow00121_45560 [Elainellaceae cyanobacterium]